jgi:hypothetical protein
MLPVDKLGEGLSLPGSTRLSGFAKRLPIMGMLAARR